MKKNFMLSLAAILMLAVSCKSVEEKEPVEQEPVEQGTIDEAKVAAFVETSEYGLYDTDLMPVFVFNKKEHEMVWNTKKAKFVIQDDYQCSLFSAELTSSEEELHYSVKISSDVSGVEAGTYNMKMVKSDGEAAWLWEVENKLGIIILQ